MGSDDFTDIFRIENTLDHLDLRLKDEYSNIQIRLSNFLERYEEEFPFEPDRFKRDQMDALNWILMRDVLFLYSLGQNDSVIIHLHGILERFASREIKKNLKFPKESKTLTDQIDRQGLFRSAKILRDFEIIDENTLKFLNKLNSLRNAVAHKDIERLSKRFGSKENLMWLDIREVVSEVDCVSLIFQSLKSLYQLYLISEKQGENLES